MRKRRTFYIIFSMLEVGRWWAGGGRRTAGLPPAHRQPTSCKMYVHFSVFFSVLAVGWRSHPAKFGKYHRRYASPRPIKTLCDQGILIRPRLRLRTARVAKPCNFYNKQLRKSAKNVRLYTSFCINNIDSIVIINVSKKQS